MTWQPESRIIGKMKNVAYILILLLTLCAVSIADDLNTDGENDTLDTEQAAKRDKEAAVEDKDSGTSLGSIIETLFKSAVEVHDAIESHESSAGEESRIRRSVSVQADEAEVVPTSTSYYSTPATPSAAATKSVSSSKGRDVFVDENKNGIDDSREQSATSKASQSK